MVRWLDGLMLRKRWVLTGACALLLLGGGIVSAEIKTDSFERTITKSVHAKYAVILPEGYDSQIEKRWPMILFLHGSGERGDDPSQLLNMKPLQYMRQTKGFPFVVVVPRCPGGEQWDPDTLNVLVDEALAKYRIDEDRVYLTGYSMGGTGTWTFAMAHPERFAAIAPVCGRVINVLAYKIKDIPIWCFHGDKDDVVNFSFSTEMVAKLKNAGAKDVEFTIYPGARHGIWDETYSNPKLYEWMLGHKRESK